MQTEVEDFIKYIKKEINRQGSCRKKLSNILIDWFDSTKKNTQLLRLLDQRLKEENIVVYTKKHNVRNQIDNWHWANLKTNYAYLTFLYNKRGLQSILNSQNVLKMNVYNEPVPTEKLFTQFATKAKEILICSAYVDDEMASLLASIAKKNKTVIRFIADNNFNSNIYKRSIIRSRIETVGTFRTMAGTNNEDGIMHLKMYVFYLPNDQITVFNNSSNFTASAWKFTNHESPVSVLQGTREDTQLAILVNAAEKLWEKSENNTSMNNFNVGDKVSHSSYGNGEIFKINSNAATVIFTGSNLQTVQLSDLTIVIDPLQMLEEGTIGPRDTIYRTRAKFLAHYLYAQNSLTNEFYDYRIKPVPHQLLALKKAITSSHGGNLLFADDVGLGKTIEAGLVIQNTIRRIGDDTARILIMCPAGLKWQWSEEMKDKFGLDFKVWKWGTSPGAEAFTGSFHGEKRLIASYHAMVVGEMEDAIVRVMQNYDLVVIDECHKFSNENTQWWQMTRGLRQNNKIGQLLLLSATPHSGDRYRFLNLLHLLDPDHFPKGGETHQSLEKVTQPSTIEQYVYRNDKLSVTDFDGKPLFKNVLSQSIDVELTSEEVAFCELVVEYIKALDKEKKHLDKTRQTQVGFVISIYRKMLASSWKNVFRSMQARYKYLLNEKLEDDGYEPLFDSEEDGEFDEVEERKIDLLIKDMKSTKILSNELDYLHKIVDSGRKLVKKNVDTKVERLIKLLNQSNKNTKFLIFTQYVRTLEIIKSALGGKEYVAEIHGAIDIEGRKGQLDKFKDKVRFMVCTEAGGEGINIQFANNVINFDMPWNPARLQQRIGRVWRYGQLKEVNCYNFYVTNSISDQKVLERLNARITEMVKNFLTHAEFNGVKPELHEALIYDTTMRVLGKAQEFESLESIMGELNEELRKKRLEDAENRIKEALNYIQKEQKDLAPTVGVKLDEIDSFYAPRSVNFLLEFAKSVSKAFGGTLIKHSNTVYEFADLDLTEISIANTSFQNKKYVFEQGTAGKTNGETLYFFGFGDDFFNHVIQAAVKQSFGGLLTFVHYSLDLPFNGVALVSSTATSVVTGNERSENYHVCSFVSLKDGQEIPVEQLLGNDWLETKATSVSVDKNVIENTLNHYLEIQKEKIKAFRHRDFILTSPTIESVIAIQS